MTKIAFIGLGAMGAGMAAAQAKAGNEVYAFDLSEAALERAAARGCRIALSAEEAVVDAQVVISMLPAGRHVKELYLRQVLPAASPQVLLIDCSTIDVQTSREVALAAREHGARFADAPVSGGIMASEAAALTFMVGCERKRTILSPPL